MSQIKGIHHVALSVADAEKSLHFYVEALGMSVLYDVYLKRDKDLESVVGMNDVSARTMMLQAGEGTLVEIWQYDNPRGRALPDDFQPADIGITHFAVCVEDVEAAYEQITRLGYRAHTTPKDLKLNTATYIRGPDNEVIELLQLTETTEPTMEFLVNHRLERLKAKGLLNEHD